MRSGTLVVLLAALASSLLLGYGSYRPAPAGASQLVLRDTHVTKIYALRHIVMYMRNSGFGRRDWMRKVHGRVLRAPGVPFDAQPSSIGLDPDGRVVVTMSVIGPLTENWWAYDVMRGRAHRIAGLPSGSCSATAVAMWRSRLAYAADCSDPSRTGVFLTNGGQRLTVSSAVARDTLKQNELLVLRGNTLAAMQDMGSPITSVMRVLDDGQVCETDVVGSLLGSLVPNEWRHQGLWLSGRNLVWWYGLEWSPDPGTMAALALPQGCGAPGPIGGFAIDKPPARHTAEAVRAVDGRWLYYADAHALRRRRLPAAPQLKPPANDNFANARWLGGKLPISATQIIGNATTEPGEPLDFPPSYARSVWYTFRPVRSQRIDVNEFVYDMRLPSAGVFEGTQLGALKHVGGFSSGETEFSVTAGTTYAISIGCYAFECYTPLTLNMTAAAG